VKFVIHYDPQSKLYFSLTNNGTNPKYTDERNILTLISSPDLFTWTVHRTLLWDDTGFDADTSVAFTGFQYVDWLFDNNNNDIIYLIRTSYRGANTYHNSNRLTYKRLANFRVLL